ncbi:CheR family methyltransferase [Pararhizobium mangrovi]|uniref:Chemotaxis protein methyltransferase n=1 Tax=Pararhizobium mangrovi TaxID=2590452 RepID=A0A506U7H4_9HYPH|nr:protein-glutamate O-methyltransferase CheR [Pararhizobium mangrovi]
MTSADFDKIASLLYAQAGIHLSGEKTALVYSRLSKRLRALGMASFREYCALLEAEDGRGGERMQMLAALTTNVTRFFREQNHFDHLRARLPALLATARDGGRVRFWSAGCSNGHEPFSLAMTILAAMPEVDRTDLRILASDIDPNVLAFGRAGIYPVEDIENVPTDMRRKWFRPVKDVARRDGPALGFALAEPVRSLVAFRELNLNGDWPMKGQFDVIFCRNVTIYFDQPTRERLWLRFAEKLKPGGILYVGHSERVAGQATGLLAYDANTAYRRIGA